MISFVLMTPALIYFLILPVWIHISGYLHRGRGGQVFIEAKFEMLLQIDVSLHAPFDGPVESEAVDVVGLRLNLRICGP